MGNSPSGNDHGQTGMPRSPARQSKGDAPPTAQVDSGCLCTYYLFMSGINTRAVDCELKRGSAEILILSLLDARPRHGYDQSKLIHTERRVTAGEHA